MEDYQIEKDVAGCYNELVAVMKKRRIQPFMKVAILEALKLDIFYTEVHVKDGRTEGLTPSEAIERKKAILQK